MRITCITAALLASLASVTAQLDIEDCIDNDAAESCKKEKGITVCIGKEEKKGGVKLKTKCQEVEKELKKDEFIERCGECPVDTDGKIPKDVLEFYEDLVDRVGEVQLRDVFPQFPP